MNLSSSVDCNKMSPAKDEAVSRANRVLGIYLGVMFLLYCATFLCACPRGDLFFAVSAEVLIFLVSLVLFRAKIFKLPSNLLKLSARTSKYVAGFRHGVGILQGARLALLAIVASLVTIDFTAFATAAFGNSACTRTLYCFPVSQLIGLHPAATLEVLAGAYVEHKEYARAEKLYMDILAVRIKMFGPKGGPVSALYADLGDLNVRQNKLDAAANWYRKSVELSESSGGPPGTGRALTGLATVLRQRGDLKESEKCYLKALAIRSRLYGTDSKQYHDTLRGYERLLGLKRQTQSS